MVEGQTTRRPPLPAFARLFMGVAMERQGWEMGQWSFGVLELWEKAKSQTQKRAGSGDLPLIDAYVRLYTPG
jgi:hypothetical protein